VSVRHVLQKLLFLLPLLGVMGGVVSCTEEVATGPRVWIDFPRDKSVGPVGTPVAVVSHAYAPEGIAEMLLSVNGEAYRRDPPQESGATFSEVSQEWLPQEAGVYTLQVQVYDTTGAASVTDSVTVKVVGQPDLTPTSTSTGAVEPTDTPPSTGTPTATTELTDTPLPTDTPTATIAPSVTPPPTDTPTPTITPERPTDTPIPPTDTPTTIPPVEVNFWADRDSLTAGECTVLHWDVEHATAVYLNSAGVVGHGTQQVCPTSTTTYNLHVEAPGGNVDRSVTINVSAPVDTQGPDISGLMSSEETIDYSCDYCPLPCKTDISANVTDDSGVAWVKLIYKPPKEGERSGGMANVGGASYKATVNANGWDAGTLEYWVRAMDNRGNVSESGHRTITVEACVY
jgi:hypothetical protein